MAESQYSGSKGFVATAALTKGELVKLSSGEVVVATAATDAIIGVTENACEAGEVVSVRLLNAGGTAKIEAGTGGWTVGQFITSDGNGHGVDTTTAGNLIVGIALKAADAGDLAEVMLTCFQYSTT